MSTLAFCLDAIDDFYDQKSRGDVAAEAEEDDEESDIQTQVAYADEYAYGQYPTEEA